MFIADKRAGNIRALRLRAGLTQMQLSEKAYICVDYLKKIEAGHHCSALVLECIATALGATADDLAHGSVGDGLPKPSRGNPTRAYKKAAGWEEPTAKGVKKKHEVSI